MIINTLVCHLSLVTFAFTLDLRQLEGVSYGCTEILPREYSFISWAHDAAHPNHCMFYYYDATALGSNYVVNDQDFHWVVVHEFEHNGWAVNDVYIGNPMRHDEKYLLINQGFAGKQRLMPYFNRQNNDDLILAVQSAGVERDRNGFRKNKSTEKNPESDEDLLEHRTDGTDAFDTLYIGCEKFPQHDFYGVAVGGVR